MLLDIFVQDIEEDLFCIDFDPDYNLLAFAGLLGVGYIYRMGPVKERVAIQEKLFSDLTRLNGHFKAIRQVKFRPRKLSGWPYLLTGSDDFSVRLWDPLAGNQLMLFLDITNQNSEVLSIDWDSDGAKFLALDVN